ncbi:MAG: molybdopterin-synthase adenylyltransferase MoeB [Chitinophagales bacterium]
MQLSNNENEYYNRQIILNDFGIDAQIKLKHARVLVIGAGGLGCPVLQYLTAAGVGNIGIVDGDVVSLSNLHRQILFTTNDIGKPKAILAKLKLDHINAYVTIDTYNENISTKNAISIIEQYDIIADCTDNFAARYLINDACVMANKPFVSASILKFEGQLSVFNHQTKINYRDVFPEPPSVAQNCAEAGVIGVLCGIIGSMQANEIIKMITGIGETLEGKLLCYDALTNKTQSFKIKSNGIEIKKLQDNYVFACETASNAIKEITVQELKHKMDNKEDFQLIDVREQQEYDLVNIGGELIPLNTVLENQKQISKTKQVIIHCKSGARSTKAIELLQQNGFTNLYNLKGGIIAYAKETDNKLSLY